MRERDRERDTDTERETRDTSQRIWILLRIFVFWRPEFVFRCVCVVFLFYFSIVFVFRHRFFLLVAVHVIFLFVRVPLPFFFSSGMSSSGMLEIPVSELDAFSHSFDWIGNWAIDWCVGSKQLMRVVQVAGSEPVLVRDKRPFPGIWSWVGPVNVMSLVCSWWSRWWDRAQSTEHRAHSIEHRA